jgi:hypothetical protein
MSKPYVKFDSTKVAAVKSVSGQHHFHEFDMMATFK